MVSRRVAATVVVTLVVVVAATGVVVAMDEAQARQEDGNFTIAEQNIDALVEEIVNEIEAELGLDEGSVPGGIPAQYYTSSVGNIIYSTVGFLLGGFLLFVSLFDTTRKPVIAFFDEIFGGRHVRRRREASTGLEARVATAFHAFTSAVDKMDAVLRLANDWK